MADKRRGEFDEWTLSIPVGRACSASASPDDGGLAVLAARARKRHRRRQWATSVSAGIALIVVIGLMTTTDGGDVHQAWRGPLDSLHTDHFTVLDSGLGLNEEFLAEEVGFEPTVA